MFEVREKSESEVLSVDVSESDHREFYTGEGSIISPESYKLYMENKQRINRLRKVETSLKLTYVKNIRRLYEFSPSKLIHSGWFGYMYKAKDKKGSGN